MEERSLATAKPSAADRAGDTRRRATALCVVVLATALSACGGGSGGSGGGTTPPPPPPPPPAAPLPGASGAAATSATSNLAPTRSPRGDIVDGVILTKLDIMLARGATVGEVNTALTSIGASIAHMRIGSPFLTLNVPRQATPQALAALARQLGSQPGIAAAFPAHVATPQVLPPGVGTGPAALLELEHLLPTRFPAAWNAKGLLAGCETSRVPVLVPDVFAATAPAGFDVEVPGALIYDIDPGTSELHGHRVTATLAAALNSTHPTGAVPFPQCLEIVGVDISNISIQEMLDRVAARFPGSGKFVISSSTGFRDYCLLNDDSEEVCSPEQFGAVLPSPHLRAVDTFLWQQLSRARWDDTLVVVAGGNDRGAESTLLYLGFGVAAYTSPMILAGHSGSNLLSGITNPAFWQGGGAYASLVPTGTELAHLENLVNGDFALITGFPDYSPAPNVLAVGSTEHNVSFAALAESSFSDVGPDVRAVGESVYVIDAALEDGTSYAAPQVAGLAAYLWLLSPDLRALPAQRTADLIRTTAASNANTSDIVDAYAAVLALDEAAPVTPLTARVRQALLDVDENGGFDGLDLLDFATAYGLNGAPPPAGERDHSRYDLNGDGYTGGIAVARFDLDRVGSTQFGASTYTLVPQTIEGVEIELNELALSDIQVLCYYAYSPLYQGSPADREDVLGIKNCINANLGAVLAAFANGSAALTVSLTDDAGAAMPDVYVELAPTGGTVSPTSGTTGASGELQVLATLNPGSSSMSVTVTARSSPGGEILDQTVVQGGASGAALLINRSGAIAAGCDVRAVDDLDGADDTQSDAIFQPEASEGPPPPPESGNVQATCNAEYSGMEASATSSASASVTEVVGLDGAVTSLGITGNAASSASITWSQPDGAEKRQAYNGVGAGVSIHWRVSIPAGVSMSVVADLHAEAHTQTGVSVTVDNDVQAIRLCGLTPEPAESGDWSFRGDWWPLYGYACQSGSDASGSLGPFVGPLNAEISVVLEATIYGNRNYTQFDPDTGQTQFILAGASGTRNASGTVSASVSFAPAP